MKKTITKAILAFSTLVTAHLNAQTIVTFDNFTLAPDTFYQDVNGTDFSVNEVTFRYDWASWGSWGGGTAYTNKKDTIFTASSTPPYYANLYSSIVGSAFSGTNYAAVQNGAIITFSNNTTSLLGFYISNSTYAWKSMKNGDQFARKFGDTTGTGSGNSIPQGEYPDWCKIIVRGFQNGAMLNDSVEFYLADYRPAGTASDYVIKNWQYVNCASLGQVDSVRIDMKSSDTGAWGMNTPGYFTIDNFTTGSTVGVQEINKLASLHLYPNPTTNNIQLNFDTNNSENVSITITDIAGKTLFDSTYQTSVGINTISINTELYQSGVYFMTIHNNTTSKQVKFIKQ